MNLNHIHPLGRYGFPESGMLLTNRTYMVLYSFERRQAKYVMWRMNDSTEPQQVDRGEAFREDPRIPAEFRATLDDYRGSGYDRGHMCPSASRRLDSLTNQEVDILSNICPQTPELNQGSWKNIEDAERRLSLEESTAELFVCCGPVFADGGTVLANKLPVPAMFWRSVLRENSTGRLDCWSFIVPNNDSPAAKPLVFLADLGAVELLAGIKLWVGLADRPQSNRKMW